MKVIHAIELLQKQLPETEVDLVIKPKCTCVFVAIGAPVKSDGCAVHHAKIYRCYHRDCVCYNYRPSRECKPSEGDWPLCSCGHIAQEHDP